MCDTTAPQMWVEEFGVGEAVCRGCFVARGMRDGALTGDHRHLPLRELVDMWAEYMGEHADVVEVGVEVEWDDYDGNESPILVECSVCGLALFYAPCDGYTNDDPGCTA